MISVKGDVCAAITETGVEKVSVCSVTPGSLELLRWSRRVSRVVLKEGVCGLTIGVSLGMPGMSKCVGLEEIGARGVRRSISLRVKGTSTG